MKRVVYGSVLNADGSSIKSSLGFVPTDRSASSMGKTAGKASLRGFEFDRREGYLYVAVRAVSARVNQNYDAFTADELRKSYASFIGRPIFVNHVNSDVSRARGFIIDAKLHDDNPMDVWVEVLHEIDAVRFPKLCAAIESGEIDTTSMGCNIEFSRCSVCPTEARFPSEFCVHIKNKGNVFERKTASGGVESVLAYEECVGVDFFEDSWVFNPADSSALVQEVMGESMRIAQSGGTRRPEAVDTLRATAECPSCGNPNFQKGGVCEICGYGEYPESTSAPDKDKAKEPSKLKVETVEPKSVADKEKADKKDTKKTDDKTKKGAVMANRKRRAEVLDTNIVWQPMSVLSGIADDEGVTFSNATYEGYVFPEASGRWYAQLFDMRDGAGSNSSERIIINVAVASLEAGKAFIENAVSDGRFGSKSAMLPSAITDEFIEAVEEFLFADGKGEDEDVVDGITSLLKTQRSGGGVHGWFDTQFQGGEYSVYGDISSSAYLSALDTAARQFPELESMVEDLESAIDSNERNASIPRKRAQWEEEDSGYGRDYVFIPNANNPDSIKVYNGDILRATYDGYSRENPVEILDGTHIKWGVGGMAVYHVQQFHDSFDSYEVVGKTAKKSFVGSINNRSYAFNDGSTAHPRVLVPHTATRGGNTMPRTASEVARARFAARRRAQVDTGFADVVTDVTVLDGASSVPTDAAPDTTTTVSTPGPEITPAAPAATDVAAPAETPVAPVNEVLLPVATDAAPEIAPVNPPVFPAEVAPAGEGIVEPLPSVTAERAALISAMSFVEARVAAGLDPTNVDKVALADRFAREYTVREMKIAKGVIAEMTSKSAAVESARGLVPRRAGTHASLPVHQRTASAPVPNEAIFGLD